MEDIISNSASFRDPAGSVEVRRDGVHRVIHRSHETEMLEFLATLKYTNLVAEQRMVGTEILGRDGKDRCLLLRHPLVAFRSYPWEWSPSLWLSAAELTLDLCGELLSVGWILKDATPLNVLFQGCEPIFVDLPSVQRVDLKSPLWFAYGQFVRTFLLPLLAFSQLGWPLQTTSIKRDGYEPEELYSVLPWWFRIRRPALSAVTLPILMANKLACKTGSTGKTASKIGTRNYDAEIAEAVIRRTLTNLKRDLRLAMPTKQRSQWSSYVETSTHYEDADHAAKLQFVRTVLSHRRPSRVLDVGCNTGVYSAVAADLGAAVIAIDTDTVAVDRVARDARKHRRNILPLCVDLARPTPATGWENTETLSFLERCRDHFDLVLMLAVVHHLLLGSQIPLGHIASLCSRLTRADLVIEWVPPSDSKFIEMLRGRGSIYTHIDERAFRDAFGEYFVTIYEEKLGNGRILLHMRKQ